jgi:serine/threonine protein kinase
MLDNWGSVQFTHTPPQLNLQYRAPEEYVGTFIDEGVDTFSLGNNIYCLLTGLWPFYPWDDYHYIQRKLLHHERAYVDPRWRTRSFIEGKLVEIMERTWEHDPTIRTSIFEVVKFLLRAKDEHLQKQKHN